MHLSSYEDFISMHLFIGISFGLGAFFFSLCLSEVVLMDGFAKLNIITKKPTSSYHGIIESLGLEGAFKGHLAQLPCNEGHHLQIRCSEPSLVWPYHTESHTPLPPIHFIEMRHVSLANY